MHAQPAGLSCFLLIEARIACMPNRTRGSDHRGQNSRFAQAQADLIEHVLQALLRQRRAFHVGNSADLLGARLTLLDRDDTLSFRGELLQHGVIRAQVRLGADENDRDTRRVVLNLRPPLALNIVKRVLRDDAEADEEDVRLRVRQRAQAIVVLLACSIPQTQVDGLAIDHHVGRVYSSATASRVCVSPQSHARQTQHGQLTVVEDGRNVFAREGVGSVADEQASLADGTITDNDALDVLPAKTARTVS